MSKVRYLTGLITTLILAGMPLASATASEVGDQEWNWRFTPMYLWAPSMKTDMRYDQPPVPSSSSFSDIISKVDIVLTGHVEGQNDKFGFMGDLSYLALSDDNDFGNFDTEASLDMTVLELAGVWSPGETRFEGFEAFGGLRHFKSKIDAKFNIDDPLLPDARRILDKSYSDFMIGARYTGNISEHTQLTVRADTSFGETGGTQNFSAIMRWNRSESRAWVFGYRYMTIKFDGPNEGLKMTQYGPVVGYEFQY